MCDSVLREYARQQKRGARVSQEDRAALVSPPPQTSAGCIARADGCKQDQITFFQSSLSDGVARGKGIVPAVVLPYLSKLMMTFSRASQDARLWR